MLFLLLLQDGKKIPTPCLRREGQWKCRLLHQLGCWGVHSYQRGCRGWGCLQMGRARGSSLLFFPLHWSLLRQNHRLSALFPSLWKKGTQLIPFVHFCCVLQVVSQHEPYQEDTVAVLPLSHHALNKHPKEQGHWIYNMVFISYICFTEYIFCFTGAYLAVV